MKTREGSVRHSVVRCLQSYAGGQEHFLGFGREVRLQATLSPLDKTLALKRIEGTVDTDWLKVPTHLAGPDLVLVFDSYLFHLCLTLMEDLNPLLQNGTYCKARLSANKTLLI